MRHPDPPFAIDNTPTIVCPRPVGLKEAMFPTGIFFTEHDYPCCRSAHSDDKETADSDDLTPFRSSKQRHLPAGLLEEDAASSDSSPHRPSPASASPAPASRQATLAQSSLPLVQSHLDQNGASPSRARSLQQSTNQQPAVGPPITTASRAGLLIPSPAPPGFSSPTDPNFVPFAYTGNGVLGSAQVLHAAGRERLSLHPTLPCPPRSQHRPLPLPPSHARRPDAQPTPGAPLPVSTSQSLQDLWAQSPVLPFTLHSPAVCSPRPASVAQSETILYRSANASQPPLDTVGSEVETNARSGFFLRECQRLARDFVACAEVVRISTVNDHAAALETLVALSELHSEVLQKLSLGEFEEVRKMLAPKKQCSPSPTCAGLARSDSSSTVSLPSLSTSSSLSHLDSLEFRSPARSQASATDSVVTSNTTQSSSSDTAPSVPGQEEGVVRPLAVTAHRWVSHTVCSSKYGGSVGSIALSARNVKRFYDLLLNKLTLRSTIASSKVLTSFVVRTLADPNAYRHAPLELFVHAALRHVTTIHAGQQAARRFSQNVAWLMLDVHNTATERGKPLEIPSILRAAIQPTLDALVDKVFPPLTAAKDRRSARASSDPRVLKLNADLPSLAIFLCFCHFFSATLVPSAWLHEMLHLLLNTPEPTDRECYAACEIFELAGQRLEKEAAEGRGKMETAWARMRVVAGKPCLSTRARFALQDMVDLKAHGWMSRSWMRSLRGLIQY